MTRQQALNTTIAKSVSIETVSMGKQTITSIRVDEELWKDAKIYAIKKGITLTDLLEQLLRRELRDSKKD